MENELITVTRIHRSEAIGQLAAALAAAQGEVQAASKDSVNPHYKSRYADLASVWEACRTALVKHGLAVLQPVSGDGSPQVTVTTILVHKSGEWIGSDLTLTAQQATLQAIGSAITYGCRYALAALVGVAPEDDDGEAAEGRGGEQQASRPPVPERAQASARRTITGCKGAGAVAGVCLMRLYTNNRRGQGAPAGFKKMSASRSASGYLIT